MSEALSADTADLRGCAGGVDPDDDGPVVRLVEVGGVTAGAGGAGPEVGDVPAGAGGAGPAVEVGDVSAGTGAAGPVVRVVDVDGLGRAGDRRPAARRAVVAAVRDHGPARERTWCPDHVLDLRGMLGPLRRGRGDPTHRSEAGREWRTCHTPAGPATLALHRTQGEVRAQAWGPGAEWVLDGLPALLGADDDDTGFVAHHDLVRDARHRLPGLRLGATGTVWDVLVPSVLEQKVTGVEARRSWRELCWRFADDAPGPAPAGMKLPPTPRQIKAIPDWEWHRAGVDSARRRALLACATVAHRLERAAELRGAEGRALLMRIPGVGPWTAAEIAQRAWGDPDAVSVGDFHIPTVVGWALVGRPLDDDGMLEVLACYAPQRQRAVRYVEASGFRRPRFGPRFSPKDYRSY